MSDAVNLASRLEGANKYFGTSIMASEMTVDLTGATFAWRELDAIRVKGRSHPVRIYEPLAESGRQTPEQAARAAIYARRPRLLARPRLRRRGRVLRARCRRRSAVRAVSARAKELATHPPGPEWEPVCMLEGK